MKTKQRLLLTIALVALATCSLFAQGLTIGSGTTFSLGGATLLLPNTWSNAGTFLAQNGTVVFTGATGTQTIANASGETFGNLTANKGSGDLQLLNNCTVNGTLALTAGDLDINGKLLTLGSSAILSETAGNTLKGGLSASTRTLNAPSSAPLMGALITSGADLGSTTVTRGHTPQTGGGGSSVARYFDIAPSNNTGLNATLVLSYDHSELNGLTETTLLPYRSTDGGTSWQQKTGTLDTAANMVTVTGVNSFSRWTLGAGLMAAPSIKISVVGPIQPTYSSNFDVALNPGEFFRLQYRLLNPTGQAIVGARVQIDTTADPMLYPYFYNRRLYFDGYIGNVNAGDSSAVTMSPALVVSSRAPNGYVLNLVFKVFDNTSTLIGVDTVKLPISGLDGARPFTYAGFNGSTIIPRYTPVGSPSTVQVTIYEGGPITQIVDTIWRADNRAVAAVVPLYDDGTHGDPTPGDHCFIGQFTPGYEGEFIMTIEATDSLGNKGRFDDGGFARFMTSTPFRQTGAASLIIDDYNGLWGVEPLKRYTTSFDRLGVTHDNWISEYYGQPDTSEMNHYATVAYMGMRVQQATQVNIIRYLDRGGKLFIAGLDIVGSTSDTSFAKDYLRASIRTRNGYYGSVVGMAGDPISSGLDLSLTGGDGANNNNQHLHNELHPILTDGPASVDTVYKISSSSTGAAAIRVLKAPYRLVCFGFPFEAISTAPNRDSVMARSLRWLKLPSIAPVQLNQQPRKTFSHMVGSLWDAISNNGLWGNTYAEPNLEWPGGSGNVYGWRSSLWIGGMIDTIGYTSYGEGNHFVPLDSIHVKHRAQGSLSAEDTYTRYTDVNPPSPSGLHVNLGVGITERTYAWDQSHNGDFIISDYWIKNIGDDVNRDGIIDVTRTLTGVYVGFRMDADVSGFNGSSTDSNYWDLDDLAGYDAANKISYLWDGDNPTTPEDDTGNPDPTTGVLRSPGYIGVELLHADSNHFVGTYSGQPAMAVPVYRTSEPTTSQAMYEFMRGHGIEPNATVPRDYRALMAVGPFTIPAGDSIHIVVAWVIGNGFNGMIANSQTAQTLFHQNYISLQPVAPTIASPASGATNQPTTLTLSWNASAGASSYRLQVSASSSFATTVTDDSALSGTSRQVGPLTATTKYYWRVNAKNADATSAWSSTWSFTTSDTVRVASDIPPGEGNLNNVIQAAITAGTLSNTVFLLEPHGYYILTGTVTVPAGQKLTIVAPEPGTTQLTSPPQILWTSNGSVSKAYMFDCFGDIFLKNVWILNATTAGDQVKSNIHMEDDPAANASGKGEVGIFEGVIFDYDPLPEDLSGSVGITAQHFKGTFRNCYFRNCTDKHFRYYGRALSFPYNSGGWHSDSVSFQNCTFANIGYVYMQEGGDYADYVKFNHCTFLNVVMFSLESGWWNKLAVTNCIFVNAYMYGASSAENWIEQPYGGTLRIDSVSAFGFGVPFTDQDRRILFANSSYFTEKWLSDWMHNNPYSVQRRANGEGDLVPVPMPMLSPRTLGFFDATANGIKVFPYMNRANLYDATNPGFQLAPTDTVLLKDFLYRKWTDNSDTSWAWKPLNSTNRLWPLEERLSYTNATLRIAGLGGLPVGDLYHWWPTEFAAWKAQAATEDVRIAQWLNTGHDPSATTLAPPSSWNFVSNTGNNGTIAVPTSINPSTGTRALQTGDAVGVFFTRNDSLICAGYSLWQDGQNMAITAWGDNDQTAMKDGFSSGESIRYKIWDAQAGKELNAMVQYQTGSTTYTANGIYVLSSLVGYTNIAHGIRLPQGWNMISSFVAPKDSTLDTVFVKIKPRMVIAKNGAGKVYWPALSINTIGKWRSKDGYQLYMQSTDTLTINGDETNPQQVPLIMSQGWSMVSYLRNSPMRSDSAVTTLGNSLVIMKNGAGQVYWPALSINTIGNMKPGAGYQMYLSSGGTLTYPANAGSSPPSVLTKTGVVAETQQEMIPEHYKVEQTETGSNATLVVKGIELKDGDEVGVRGANGKIFGSGVVQSNRAVMAVWGDNILTEQEKEGAVEGEGLVISVWSKSGNKERSVSITSLTDGLSGQKVSKNLTYAMDGVWEVEIGEVEQIPTVFSLEQNYPNPFNPSTVIRYGIPKDARVKLEVYSVLGQKVMKLVDEEQKAGYYEVVFQANNISSGVYFYTILAGENRVTKKLILLR